MYTARKRQLPCLLFISLTSEKEPKIRIKVSAVILAATLGGGLTPSLSSADEPRVGRISDPLTLEECSACHIAYQSGLLPQRSWVYTMDNLSDHYGEDASLSDAAAEDIIAYLIRSAMDAASTNGRFMRGIGADEIPPRITEFSWFVSEHGSRRFSQAENNSDIGSISNCTACHRGAERGNFDDD